jgi:signal transduction histidine kinase
VALERAGHRDANAELEKEIGDLRIVRGRQEHALRIVGHDLRTPLGAVRGYVDLFESGFLGPLTPAQRKAMDRIRVATVHIDGLVENALEMSRLHAGEVAVKATEVELRPVVEDSMGLMELHAERAGITLRIEVPSDMSVCADPARLRQVLVQLLDNAIKYAPPQTEVRVSAFVEDGSDPHVAIRVQDGGSGIPLGDAERVFEPYQRLASGSGSGSGLGLTIARAVTRLMAGDLVLEQNGQPGATFTLRLPAA